MAKPWYLAIKIPPTLLSLITVLIQKLDGIIKPVPLSSVHMTFVFCGKIKKYSENYKILNNIIQKINNMFEKTDIVLNGVEVVKIGNKNNLLAISFEKCNFLEKIVQDTYMELGITDDFQDNFLPHITLGKLINPNENIPQKIQNDINEFAKIMHFEVNEIELRGYERKEIW